VCFFAGLTASVVMVTVPVSRASCWPLLLAAGSAALMEKQALGVFSGLLDGGRISPNTVEIGASHSLR